MKNNVERQKKSFHFKLKWYEILRPFAPEIRLEVYEAVFAYVATGVIEDGLSEQASMAFAFIRAEIDGKSSRKPAETDSAADECAEGADCQIDGMDAGRQGGPDMPPEIRVAKRRGDSSRLKKTHTVGDVIAETAAVGRIGPGALGEPQGRSCAEMM